MIIFLITYILLVQSTILNAAPLQDENSFFNALVKSCPSLNLNDTPYKNQNIFKNCKSYQHISQTKQLTEETALNMRCLLYYDSFVSFCTQLKAFPNITVKLVPTLTDYQVTKICQNLSMFRDPKKFEHNIDQLIDSEASCYKLCTADYHNTVVQECGLAYYFVTYNISQIEGITSVVKPANDNSNVQLESEGQSSTAANSQALKGGAQLPPEKNLKNVRHDVSNTDIEQQPQQKINKPETVLNNSVQTTEKLNAVPVVKNNSHPDLDNNANAQPVNNEKASAVSDSGTSPDLKKPSTAIQNSKVEAGPAGDIPDEVSQDVPPNEQPKVDDDKGGETNLIDQQSSPDQMSDDDQNMDNGDDNDVEFSEKEDEEKPETNKDVEQKQEKPSTLTRGGEFPANYNTTEELDGDSYFFSYFMVICVLFVLGYVGYHNRQKVMALMLEGKRGKRQVRGKRPNSANYHKLDSNLEEAISSTCTKNSSHVIY